MATSRDKNQLKLLLGKGNGLLRPKRNMFFEGLSNNWAFFSDRIPNWLCTLLCGRWSILYWFSQKLTVLLAPSACAFHIFRVRFPIFSLFLLLVKFCYHDIQKATLKPTKNMKNPYIELVVDITAHNNLIFHSLFLLFCSSIRMNAVAASNWLPQFCKKDTT